MHRSRAALVRDRIRHLARIKDVLALQGVRHVDAARKDWMSLLKNLQPLSGLGPTMSTVFVTELFYKTFDNRRQLASYAGLTPTPYNSGSRERDQGISKAGNPIVRHHAVELAWLWLMHQPDSAISQWFRERVGDAKGRVR